MVTRNLSFIYCHFFPIRKLIFGGGSGSSGGGSGKKDSGSHGGSGGKESPLTNAAPSSGRPNSACKDEEARKSKGDREQ